MGFAGDKKDNERADLIAYLAHAVRQSGAAAGRRRSARR